MSKLNFDLYENKIKNLGLQKKGLLMKTFLLVYQLPRFQTMAQKLFLTPKLSTNLMIHKIHIAFLLSKTFQMKYDTPSLSQLKISRR